MATITTPVQIALLDDHPLFRQGMRYILQALPYVESVVEAGDFSELQALCRQRLLEKTGAANAAGLVVYAVRHGLLDA